MIVKTLISRILLGFCFFAVTTMYAQIEYKIDLAKNEGDVIELPITAGKEFKISIVNRLPNENYTLTVEKKVSEIPVFENPFTVAKDSNTCDFSKKIKDLDTLKDEKELSIKVEEIRSDIKKSSCTKEQKNIAYGLLTDATTLHESTHILNVGEQLEVTISRKVKGSDVAKVWKRVYKTQARGKWITTYGFSFITDAFSKNETYFLDQENSVFTVTKNHREKKLLYVPTVFFSWIPTKKLNQDIAPSFTGGLGFDLESPVVFLGYSLTYNQNLSLTIGLSAHNQDFLRGEYNVGDELSSALTTDQLHDKRYVVNPFVSLAFRFGSPIFKTASAGTGD